MLVFFLKLACIGWHSGGLCSEPINLSNGHERTPCHPSPHDRIPSSEEDNVAMNDDDKLSVNDQHTGESFLSNCLYHA